MENIVKSEFSQSCKRVLKGSIISLIINLIFLFIFALLLAYTNIQERIIAPVVIVISAISILIGSSISSLKIKKNGLLNGGIIGFFYIASIYLLSSLTGAGFSLNLNSIIMIISSIIAGMIGGIIGVNLK